MKQLKQAWRDISLKTKTSLLMGASLLAMWIIVLIVVLQLQNFTQRSAVIMNEYRDITGFMNAFSTENVCLEYYMRPAETLDAQAVYLEASAKTDECLQELRPNWLNDQYEVFLLKQAIWNAMPYYRNSQSLLLEIDTYEEKIDMYLSLKTQASYIDQYSRVLLDISMDYGGEQWQQIEETNTQASKQFLMIMLIFTIALVGILLIFNRTILKPLDDLSHAADTISAGRYDAPPLEILGNNELGRTARSFNLMQTEIRRSFHAMEKQAEMEKQLLEKEVEAIRMQQMLQEGRFAQLQSQINPHFLFNTLNTIAAMAREESAPLSEDLIVRLSNFFRYSLGSEEKLVPLGKEIQLLRDYMELQEIRFGERITMKVRSDTTAESIMVPKFILQPLVENSILHGLKECKNGGLIRVRVHKGPGSVTIYVTDNGCGFDVHSPQKNREAHRSLGLVNIAERVDLSGGSLKIFSRLGLGTSVRITIKEEHQHNHD